MSSQNNTPTNGIIIDNEEKFNSNTLAKIADIDMSGNDEIGFAMKTYLRDNLRASLVRKKVFSADEDETVELVSTNVYGVDFSGKYTSSIENGYLYISTVIEANGKDITTVSTPTIQYNINSCQSCGIFVVNMQMYKVHITYNDSNVDIFRAISYTYNDQGVRFKITPTYEMFVPYNNVRSIKESLIE